MTTNRFCNTDDKYIEIIKKSNLFDAEWYLSNYLDVSLLEMDPAYHYLKYGTLLERDPGPFFSSSFYYDTRGWVKKKGINPLLHYLTRNKNVLPKPDNVLWAADRVVKRSNEYDLAIDLAKQSLPEDLHYTINAIIANKSLHNKNEIEWLKSVNNYLSNFNIHPIDLKGDSVSGSLFSRLLCNVNSIVRDGPLISIIMPAWNAEDTIKYSIDSILNQTWRNIELIVVDDSSTDKTYSVAKAIEKKDCRVKVLRNNVNVGPYVSKNIGLSLASGKYITGHDADDWAHPQRIENHMREIVKSGNPRASLTYMFRILPNGYFGHIGKISGFSFDGVARKASISCMFERDFIRNVLGYWDSVRFGADSEMISRSEHLLGDEFKSFKQISMICLELETSLTNDPMHGVRANNGGLSLSRKKYSDSWKNWHKSNLSFDNARLDFPQKMRRYEAIDEMIVSFNDQVSNKVEC